MYFGKTQCIHEITEEAGFSENQAEALFFLEFYFYIAH